MVSGTTTVHLTHVRTAEQITIMIRRDQSLDGSSPTSPTHTGRIKELELEPCIKSSVAMTWEYN